MQENLRGTVSTNQRSIGLEMTDNLLSLVIFLPIGIMIIELVVHGLSVLWKWFIQTEE